MNTTEIEFLDRNGVKVMQVKMPIDNLNEDEMGELVTDVKMTIEKIVNFREARLKEEARKKHGNNKIQG